MKRTSFGDVSSRRSCSSSQSHSTSASSALVVGIDLDYCDDKWFAFETNRDHSVILKLHLSTEFQTILLTMCSV